MPYADPEATKAASRRHYERNALAVAAAAKTERERKRAWLQEQRDQPCADCGGSFPVVCMDFDHIPGRGPKEFYIGRKGVSVSWARLRAEVAKCEVVCANCHRIRTESRGLEPGGYAG